MSFSFSASMIRWKPSVRSCVSSAAAVLRAASAISSSRSIHIINVLGDVLGQAKRVLADQVLGALGVARFQGLDDVHVIVDRALDPVILSDRTAADHAHMGEQVFREL